MSAASTAPRRRIAETLLLAALVAASAGVAELRLPATAHANQLWLAAAYSAKTRGISIDGADTQDGAIRGTLADCNTTHNTNDCAVAVTGQQCVGIAVLNNGGWAGGTGPTPRAAITEAVRVTGGWGDVASSRARCTFDPQAE